MSCENCSNLKIRAFNYPELLQKWEKIYAPLISQKVMKKDYEGKQKDMELLLIRLSCDLFTVQRAFYSVSTLSEVKISLKGKLSWVIVSFIPSEIWCCANV